MTLATLDPAGVVELLDLPVAVLAPGADARIDDDPVALAELAQSIREHGVLCPLVVRRVDSGWEVIAGRRRLAAARHVDLGTVPCIVRDCDDDEAFDLALAENMHRRRLSPVEEALAYQAMRARGVAVAQIARRVGRTAMHVYSLFKVLELPPAIRDRIHAGSVAYSTVLAHPERYGLDGSYQYLTPRDKDKPRMVGAAGDDELAAINHWRRRHDRVVAGIRAILRTPKADPRASLRRLLQVDLTPLDDIPERDPDWRASFPKKGARA